MGGFDEQMHRVLPEARFVKLDNTHPIFDSFFTIHDIDCRSSTRCRGFVRAITASSKTTIRRNG
jgi:hypothetical protein